ncbi:hypothetical protein HPB50_015895 [Hyalomma asiaticum]|uniref:Uncharacterized protein n=1 Tax=Hyalomma asiaticum TaxID=266040 RepID=A0ACB7SHH5_HYAAI|nr:hypothetical protein HPB50_015895 [Hyalomma asiaticum]
MPGGVRPAFQGNMAASTLAQHGYDPHAMAWRRLRFPKNFAVNTKRGQALLHGNLRQDGDNVCHGVIVVSNIDTTEMLRESVRWRSGTIVEVRKFGTSNKMHVTFAGKDKPHFVHYDTSIIPIQPWPAAGAVSLAIERTLVRTQDRIRVACVPLVEEGVWAPHDCVPLCSVCGGAHATNSRACTAKYRNPKMATQQGGKSKRATKKRCQLQAPSGPSCRDVAKTDNPGTPTGEVGKQPSMPPPLHSGSGTKLALGKVAYNAALQPNVDDKRAVLACDRAFCVIFVRVIKILKAEYWRQVCLFYDYLCLVLAEETHQSSTDRHFREFKKLAAQSTEFLRQRARAGLPPRPKQERTAANSATIIGDCSLLDRWHRILDNGPKYSFEPAVQRHQLLAIARQAACRTDVRERNRATSDAVNCGFSKAGSHPSKKPPFKYVVDTLEQRSLAILQADKERGFFRHGQRKVQ